MIFIVVRFTVRPERGADWLDLVKDFTTATRAEPGNLFFDWNASVETPNQFVLLEAFADGDAGAAHVNSEHFRTAMAWMPKVIAKKPEIINVTLEQSGWSEMAELTPVEP
ncbi:MAG TPA: putative quinol monooxygenase [Pseudonocardiaceae bacterium]|jgi:quinol monooxygenase YgiN|nr:putative quinol monooxygenase [Pseudonocardiaceae bacterium]